MSAANRDRPIADLLHDLDLSHRPTREEFQAREVYDRTTGERLGLMTAAEAVAYPQDPGRAVTVC